MNQVISVVLTANTSSFKSSMASAAAATTSFGQAAEGSAQRSTAAWQGMSKVALGVGVGLLAGFGAAAGAAMKFDQQMSATGAAAGATGSQLNALREQALQMGADTAFSAREAAQAQEELAKAGLTTSQILGGALPAALTLAAAGGIELATASEYMADTLTQFNLSAGEAAHVADVLAAGAGKSSTDVDGLSQALNQSALVANQMGISLEETVGTLSLFAAEGLKGSDAGTSLKTALQRLANPSAQAAQLMNRLGIDVFDANGNFVGLAGTAAELQSSLAGMTVEQRSATLAQLGGADAVRSLSILYESGASGVNEWTRNVDDAGYAADQADKRLDNLAGDLEALGGSLETALIEGGSKATGVLRMLVQGATGAVNAFSGLPGPAQTAIVAFAGVGGAATTLVGAIGLLSPKLTAGLAALEAMGPAGRAAAAGLRTAASAAGKFALLGVGVYAANQLAEALIPLEEADLSRLERDLLELGQSGRLTGEAADVLGGDMDSLAESLHRVAEPGNTDRIKDVLGNITTFGSDTRSLEQARQRIDDVDKALASLQARDPTAARRTFDEIADAMQTQGISTDQLNSLFDDYDSALAETETANETAASAMEGTTGAVEGQADAFNAGAEAIQLYKDAMQALTDPVFAMTSAMQGHRDAQSEVAAAELELAAARQEGDPLAIMAAETALSDARLGAVESAFGLEQAELDLAAAMAENPALVDEMNRKLYEFVATGQLTQAEAEEMAAALGIYNERAAAVPERIESTAALNDEVTSPLEIVAARLLGWDGQTGTADAFLQDLASTPMGAIQVQLAMWNASQGTADVNADTSGADAAFNHALARMFGWDGTTGTADAFLADHASTPLGAIEAHLAGYNASSGTADANVNDNASGVLASINRQLSALDGRHVQSTATVTHRTVFVHEQLRGHTTSGAQLRMGGITNAQTGLIQAGIHRAPTVYFAEPATGGEAFIPKLGNHQRSMAILQQAASWYGATVLPKGTVAAQAGVVFGAGMSGTGIDVRSGFDGLADAIWDSTNHQIRADAVHHHHLVGWLGTNVKRYLDWTTNGIETLIRMEQLGAKNVRWFEDLNSIPRFDKGGTVPGRIGEPQLIVAHGGEEVLRHGQRQGGGTVIDHSINMPVRVNVDVRAGDMVDGGQQLERRITSGVNNGINAVLRELVRQQRKRPGR